MADIEKILYRQTFDDLNATHNTSSNDKAYYNKEKMI